MNMGNYKNYTALYGALVMMTLLVSACASGGGSRLGAMTEEGLRKVNFPSLEYLAMRPGTNLTEYNRIHLAPVTVSLAKNWQPAQTGSRVAMSPVQREALEREVGEQFTREFRKELEANSRLTLVDAPAAGVLVITPHLVNVKLTGTNTKAQPVGTVARSTGHVGMELELVDATDSTLLVRVKDSRKGEATVGGETSEVSNEAAIARIFSAWGNFTSNGLLTLALKAENTQ